METRTLWRAWNKTREIQAGLARMRKRGNSRIAIASDDPALQWQKLEPLRMKLEARLLVRTGLITTWYGHSHIGSYGLTKGFDNFKKCNPDERDRILKEITDPEYNMCKQDIRDYMQWVDLIRKELKDAVLWKYLGEGMEWYHGDHYETDLDHTTFWGYNKEG